MLGLGGLFGVGLGGGGGNSTQLYCFNILVGLWLKKCSLE